MPSVPRATGFAKRAGTRVPHGVVHVRARVVNDRARQSVIVGEVHAVHDEPVLAAQVAEAVGRVAVVGPLGDVDVHSDAVLGGELGGGRQRVVGARERGMDTNHPPPAGGEVAVVLVEAAPGAVGPMAVGDAVRRAHPHADFSARVGDDRQRAFDRVRRLVMVDDRRAAAFERLERAELGRPLDQVEVEGAVEPPPDELEDLAEPGRHARRCRHAARQRRVEVVVGADHAGGLVGRERDHGGAMAPLRSTIRPYASGRR